jgi:hypothetical protein
VRGLDFAPITAKVRPTHVITQYQNDIWSGVRWGLASGFWEKPKKKAQKQSPPPGNPAMMIGTQRHPLTTSLERSKDNQKPHPLLTPTGSYRILKIQADWESAG